MKTVKLVKLKLGNTSAIGFQRAGTRASTEFYQFYQFYQIYQFFLFSLFQPHPPKWSLTNCRLSALWIAALCGRPGCHFELRLRSFDLTHFSTSTESQPTARLPMA